MTIDMAAIKRHHLDLRRKAREALEAERGTTVLTLIHRPEPWSEYAGEISFADGERILKRIRAAPDGRPIDIVLHTEGGMVNAAEQIAMALRAHPAKVTAIIPFYAMSGGTLIALAADEILMEPASVLGPVDPQIEGNPSRSLIELLKRKDINSIRDEIIINADIAQMASTNARRFLGFLLRDRLSVEAAATVTEFLSGGYMAHETPVFLAEVRKLGLPVSQGVPQAVYGMFHDCDEEDCFVKTPAEEDLAESAPDGPASPDVDQG